ncbi:hypothetical protein B0T14DRAFT_526266 [Immersiella caudata]|uniref:Uncharacterized protein n=1 Tax=Immersiella caudata TaxID=314043 RepID=A0AA39WDL1_9PEZI|nr:hypothetical protein B0T14DRAFT_526266 [Immersiella caudata]
MAPGAPVIPGAVYAAVPAIQAHRPAQAPAPLYIQVPAPSQAPLQNPAAATNTSTTALASAPAVAPTLTARTSATPARSAGPREFPGRCPPGMDPYVFRRQDSIAFFELITAKDRNPLPPRVLRPGKPWDDHDCRVLEYAASHWKNYQRVRNELYNFCDKGYTVEHIRAQLGELWGSGWDR